LIQEFGSPANDDRRLISEQKDIAKRCRTYAIEFVYLSAYHQAVVALIFVVSHRPKDRTSSYRSSRIGL
jgi:hypothetical protein